MGEKQTKPFQLSFNGLLKVDFQGSHVTSDGGLLLVRELDERLGLGKLINEHLSDSRQGTNKQFTLADLLRQSVYSRLAGYEDLNDAERISIDPTFRLIGSQKIWDRGAALTSTLHGFETEMLASEENLLGLMALNRGLVGQGEAFDDSERVVLDMDSTESPVHGQQEGSAYNGHFESVCYHPLLLFNQHGDCLAAKLRPGNVHSAEDWGELLLPEIERQQAEGKQVTLRADAAFAKPEIYEALEERGADYAIRIPANKSLELEIEDILFRPPGRPSRKPLVRYKSFRYQAESWSQPRRIVAKVEHHQGELFPRVGFVVTSMSLPSRSVVRFYNKRGTAEQWIKAESGVYTFPFQGVSYDPTPGRCWVTTPEKMERLAKAQRLFVEGEFPRFVSFHIDFSFQKLTHPWRDTAPAQDKAYVVETNPNVIERCLLMTTDPGDLVLDPTCGSGTTAYVVEQWGRRWITIDTSRVALALARARIMGARYPYYLLSDSRDGQLKEAEVTHKALSSARTYNDIRQGFVYERVPHITLKSIANNAEIDVIWEKFQGALEPLREKLNAALKKTWQEWEIPRAADAAWSDAARKLHADWWQARIARQKEIDASIAAKADHEYLYDKPYENKKVVRVAGPFTVESLSPHRVLGVGEDDELIDIREKDSTAYGAKQSFPQMILENLKTSGVQQAHKGDRIAFTALTPWPGELVCAKGRYLEGETEKRAAIFIGPEFGTVQRADLVAGAREAGDTGFDVLIACAFNYEAHAVEFSKLGRIPVLKARMNADLHMAEDLKNTGKGNLFVIFGEPDIELLPQPDGRLRVKVKGVDVFDPSTGEVRSDGADGIACWFIDTDYNEESFFVRHAYFLGANDPYKALKTTLKAEINQESWGTLHSDTSRPFDRPKSGRIAMKVINHLGDEVMKVFKI